jgi:Mn2+/Fe2+ NRAMP family transporter
MWNRRRRRRAQRSTAPVIPHTEPAPSSLEAAVARERNPLKRFFKILGPGLVTGASDDDPSGIGTYAIAGASLGFSTLWTALVTFPMMAVVQFTCAKVGMVTGMGLAGVLSKHYSKALLYPMVAGLVVANTINAGTDIGAIAAAVNLLVPIPIPAMIVPVALIILALISPYLFFWQASHEVEEEISMGRRTLKARHGATDKELRYAELDVTTGMLFSNVVMYFIILATTATLFKAGQTDIQSAAEAAQALRPLAGDAASVLLALGLIGAGFLAVPILTGSSAYAMAEALGWKHGLDEKPRRAKLFYVMIIVPTLIGLLINFVGINPIRALFWTAVINGFVAPPMLVVIMLIANNRRIMGERVNSTGTNVVGWATTVVMFGAAAGLALTWGR